ncbi:MOSC domain-containing protein [Streptomonospora sp. PA3]|uniref:MOSC domain-containing protein n=1 Tax=Streptomonospora sp. PA3 TaxID=2607326 RepID=UPI0012DFA066|nr:MOSC N-terminal beta barrel domain-containing protein [Streptomonospora sp. PA3]MUL43178.1 MOSC domain-containing protein [Streptomonospora sp. PA3]
MPYVDALLCYPVKGCGATVLTESGIGPAGLCYDRSFMVVDADGVFRSQRGTPRLAVIRPEITDSGRKLRLRAPGHGSVAIAVRTDGDRRRVELFGTAYTGLDQGEEAARWLSEVVGAPSRLVRVPPDHDRRTSGHTPGTSGYADSCAVLVVSRASLADLGRRIAERGRTPVPADRFRPNIILGGDEAPYTEDAMRILAVGGAELGYAKPAIRCAVTTVDQATGAKAGPEPLATLARYRRTSAGGVAFGAKFAVLSPGAVAVGDEVAVGWGDSAEAPSAPRP